MIVKHAFTGSRLSKTGNLTSREPNKVATYLKQNSTTVVLDGVNNILNNNRNECIMFDLGQMDHLFEPVDKESDNSDSDSVNSYLANMGKNVNAW